MIYAPESEFLMVESSVAIKKDVGVHKNASLFDSISDGKHIVFTMVHDMVQMSLIINTILGGLSNRATIVDSPVYEAVSKTFICSTNVI